MNEENTYKHRSTTVSDVRTRQVYFNYADKTGRWYFGLDKITV